MWQQDAEQNDGSILPSQVAISWRQLVVPVLCFVIPAALTALIYAAKRFDYVVQPASWISGLEAPGYPVRWNLEEYRVADDGFYHIRGWAYPPHGPRWLNTKVVLIRPSQSSPVQRPASAVVLRTNLENRHDVTIAASDGSDYDRSGFFALAPRKLVAQEGYTRVMLLVEKDGRNSLIDTGQGLDREGP